MRGVIPPWLPVAFVAVPLSGCANLAPDRAQPELTAQIPSDFPNSESVGDYRPEAWWTAFDDPVHGAHPLAATDDLETTALLSLGDDEVLQHAPRLDVKGQAFLEFGIGALADVVFALVELAQRDKLHWSDS